MAATEPDFDAVFDRLKAILEPYARELYVSADGAFHRVAALLDAGDSAGSTAQMADQEALQGR
jgi:hypothetical protein